MMKGTMGSTRLIFLPLERSAFMKMFGLECWLMRCASFDWFCFWIIPAIKMSSSEEEDLATTSIYSHFEFTSNLTSVLTLKFSMMTENMDVGVRVMMTMRGQLVICISFKSFLNANFWYWAEHHDHVELVNMSMKEYLSFSGMFDRYHRLDNVQCWSVLA